MNSIQQLNALLEQCNLSNWELDFVCSVDRRVRGGEALTGKQADTIQRIYCDRVVRGKDGRDDE